VKALKRVRIMNIKLGNLACGNTRAISPIELRQLKLLLGL
jgi:16S rRNA U516 pseudouridylate synthase RsuA-like enzyme